MDLSDHEIRSRFLLMEWRCPSSPMEFNVTCHPCKCTPSPCQVDSRVYDRDCDFYLRTQIFQIQMYDGQHGSVEKNFDGTTFFPNVNGRTYFVAFCLLIQLQILLDIPTSMPVSEVALPLLPSEEEWSAETAEQWDRLHNSPIAPPTPDFKQVLGTLFAGPEECVQMYSEFGGLHYDLSDFSDDFECISVG